uniref:Uncharacterized protein n=1 Tax=Dicentrarchus labrax TaxID=13489 RepID=E6ZI39_DICLA|nr:Uncharacterized protein [Dicentrarchus labrax]
MEEINAEEKKEEETRTSLFHLLMAKRKDSDEDAVRIKLNKEERSYIADYKIVLQRLIVIARLPHHLADRTELGAHYEKLHFQLSKQYMWDHMTGLLLIYPSCLLHIIEVLSEAQAVGDTGAKSPEEEEEASTETLVCTVLSALQKLSEHLETSRALPGLVLDETPELIVSQEVLEELWARDELQTPQQHLQMYNSPLNISMDFGERLEIRYS